MRNEASLEQWLARVFALLPVLQLVLLGAKMTSLVTWSWGWILLPAWIVVGSFVVLSGLLGGLAVGVTIWKAWDRARQAQERRR